VRRLPATRSVWSACVFSAALGLPVHGQGELFIEPSLPNLQETEMHRSNDSAALVLNSFDANSAQPFASAKDEAKLKRKRKEKI